MSPETVWEEHDPRLNDRTKNGGLLSRVFGALFSALPTTYQVLPDISHWTGIVDMDVMATKTDALIIKGLDGKVRSRYFVENYTAAKSKGIKVSAYQWLYPGDKVSIRGQAQALTDLLRQYPVDFGPFIDFEWTRYAGQPANPVASDLYGMLEYFNEMNGWYPGIYTAKGYWDEYGNTSSYWKDKILWVANYGVSSPAVPAPWTTWTLWQYTPSGPAQEYGVDPDFQKGIDLNRFNGTRAEYLAFINSDQTVPEEPPDESQELFPGAVLHKIRRFRTNCYLLVLDLEVLDTVVTPPDVGEKHHPRTVSQFAEQFDVDVAVNADGFNYVQDMVKVISLNAAKGKVYGSQLENRPVINISLHDFISFAWKDLETINLWNAVSGDRYILENGIYNTAITDPAVDPRTAAGKTAEGLLVLLVADGRQPGITEGLTFPQIASVFREFDVVTAINLDGGGSSTLYADNKVQNIPIDNNIPGKERAVANHLGFKMKSEEPMPDAVYSCEVLNYFDKDVSVRRQPDPTSPAIRKMPPGTKFSGYELFVEEPGRKVWMNAGDGWVTVLWPNSEQIASGSGTTERVKYTLIDPGTQPPTAGKVVSILVTYEDGSTQEFTPKDS